MSWKTSQRRRIAMKPSGATAGPEDSGPPPPARVAAPPSRESAATQLEQVIEGRGWRCETGSPAHTAAVSAIERLHDEELDILLAQQHYAQDLD